MGRRSLSSFARRGACITSLGVVAVVGVGLWVGGALAVLDAADLAGSRPAATGPPSTTTTVASATTSTVAASPSTTTAPVAPAGGAQLEPGEEGDEISALQARLDELGYWHGSSDGRYGHVTRQAVMAFQKAEGLGRDGVAGPATQAAMATASRLTPRDPSGDHIEVDLARQLLLVVEDGQTRWVVNISTGSGEAYATPSGGTSVATTPPGQFVVEREIDGLRSAPLGTLYRPKYFNGGIAIHGAGEIPAQPASHGCVRVTNAAMDVLWSSGVTDLGTPVLVY